MARTRTWLVTGAASGIGRELARQIAQKGERLILWDRDAHNLGVVASLLGPSVVHHEALDVTDHGAVLAAADRVGVDLTRVVHCAGILRVGDALSMSAHDYRAMLEVNTLGSVHVAQALVPLLRANTSRFTRGSFAFVSSIAGLRGIPTLAGYSASKFAVVGFAQALRSELTGSFVDVRVICPPAVDTPMVQNLTSLPAVYRLSPPQPVEKVARAILKSLERPGFLSLLDAPSRLLWKLERTVPESVDFALRWANRKQG